MFPHCFHEFCCSAWLAFKHARSLARFCPVTYCRSEALVQRAKKLLDRSIVDMDPYDTEMQQWCTDAAAKLRRSAAMPESEWPEVDRLVNGFEYHFGDISEWPNDMVRVHPVDRTETATCFLGSLAALRCLRDTKEVHVVISLCTSEMQRIRGQPEEGWAAFLLGMSVEHVTIDLDDPRTKWPGEDSFCEEMGNCYVAAWQSMCVQISRSLSERGDKLSTGLLFHCFGGINRSSAALATWLIFKHAMNADDAIDVLLKARPTLNPWVKRPHILWALKTWEKRRLSVWEVVERALSEMTPTPKRSKCSMSM